MTPMALTPPTVDELATKMKGRLKGPYGSEPTFNENTTPTATEVAELIDTAMTLVVAIIGDGTLPTRLEKAAKTAVVFKAAALVVMTYPTGDEATDTAEYDRYETQYNQVVSALRNGLRGHDATSKPGIRTVGLVGPNGYVRHPS